MLFRSIGQMMEDGIVGMGIAQIWTSEVGIDDLKMAAEINDWALKYRPRAILYDKYATESIAERLRQTGHVLEDVSGQRFYQACSDLKDALDNGRLIHSGQKSWVDSMNNCAMKVNDSGWRIVKRKSAGSVSSAISTAMVIHELAKPQTTPSIIAF